MPRHCHPAHSSGILLFLPAALGTIKPDFKGSRGRCQLGRAGHAGTCCCPRAAELQRVSVTDRDASQQFIFHINFDYEFLYGCRVQFSKGKFPPPLHTGQKKKKNQIDLKLFFPKFLVESWLDTSCLKCNYTVINNFPPLFSVSTIPLPCGQWKFPPFIRLDSLALRKTLLMASLSASSQILGDFPPTNTKAGARAG